MVGRAFLDNRYKTLDELGYKTDVEPMMIESGQYTFFHYTHEKYVEEILTENSGLYARRPVACPDPPAEFRDAFLVEGFLQPLPCWLSRNEYFGSLGLELVMKYIGDLLLEITVPIHFPGLYIADYAHIMECKLGSNPTARGLGLGYDCTNGKECTQSFVNSYLPISHYNGQHIAPVVQVIRKGKGLVIPREYIRVSGVQPRKNAHDDIN